MIRRLLQISFTIFIILTVYATYDYYVYLQKRHTNSIEIGEKVVEEISVEIEHVLTSISDRTKKLADTLELNDLRGDDLLDLLKTECLKNDQLVGVAVSYEPYQYDENTDRSVVHLKSYWIAQSKCFRVICSLFSSI